MNLGSTHTQPEGCSDQGDKYFISVAPLRNAHGGPPVKHDNQAQIFQRAWKVLAENGASGLWIAEVLEYATDEVWLLDRTGVVFHANIGGRKIYPVGADWLKFQPATLDAWHRLTTTDAVKLEATTILPKVGRRRICLLKSRFHERDHVLVIARRDRLRVTPAESEGIDDNWIVGAVMSGYVHELSEAMTSVMAATALLETQDSDLPCQQTIRLMLAAIRRNERVVAQMKLLVDRRSTGLVPIATRGFLGSLKCALASSLPKSIQIKFDLPQELPEICADPGMLLRTLLTLCIWTSEPMEMEGVLRLRAESVWCSRGGGTPPLIGVQLTVEASSGFYAMKSLNVDGRTGVFIPEEVLNEIKSKLSGMRVSLELDCGHQGKVIAKVLLPCLEATPGHLPLQCADGRGERLLVCDDDPTTLNLLTMLLQKHGYVVDTAANGSEAIAVFTKSLTPHDLVICDVRMPQMDGISTLRAMQAIRCSVRFLLMSGSGVPADDIFSSLSGLVTFLPKPFEASVFLDQVARLLIRKSGETTVPLPSHPMDFHPAHV